MDPIEAALADLESQNPPNYSATARKYNVGRSTLSRRHRGLTVSREAYIENISILTQEQENNLISYIKRLTAMSLPPTNKMVENFVHDLTGHWVHKNFVTEWWQKHSDVLGSSYLTPIDLNRTKADNNFLYSRYFSLVEKKIAEYDIQPHNIYNMDEKGFLIGVLNKLKRIFCKEDYDVGKLKGAGQDGNRDWITLLASICADGSYLPPALIYQGESGDVQNSWLQDYEPSSQEAFFTASPTGWTNDNLGFEWLTKVFDRHTKAKARHGRDWRLLIVDGHGSHVNMTFINWAVAHQIAVLVFPPHSTHTLQPLDVGVFRPLSGYYTQEVTQYLHWTQGLVAITKKDFFRFFWVAFNKAFTEKNISHAWERTGLHPFAPEVILNPRPKKRKNRVPTPPPKEEPMRPLSAKDTRKIRELLDATTSRTSREGKQLRSTVWELADAKNLLKQEVSGLKIALKAEKRKRTRKKGLFEELREVDEGNCLWLSPNKVQLARDLQAKREQEALQEKLQKEEDKRLKALAKEQEKLAVEQRKREREAAKIQREIQRDAEREAKRLAREEALYDREVKKQLKKYSRSTRSKGKKKSTAIAAITESLLDVHEADSPSEVDGPPSRPGRARKLPAHFKDYIIEID
ncbi:DDE-domain-containing protein [Zopfia rhizophila CBS 207.26]|uniref:DDE-domain-containing protein n=1 Tax=Zopfia rhizophila CBS 207.26 TaxID=1314779 RepID=A0A6A6DSJ3_9PEZI|nr:DDE-domain-containing protein [Zopfia rhizophila CBS 207.26]